MWLKAFTVSALLIGAGCSGGSSNNGTPDPGNENPGTSGATSGVWLGNTGFGDSVFIIDANENLYGFSDNGAGSYETIFADATGAAEVFAHRDSDDSSLGDSFTVVGDAETTRNYSLTTANEGQSLNNSGSAGIFSLTLADQNDVPALSVAAVVGTWVALTGIGTPPNAGLLVVTLTIAGNGDVTGSTQYAAGDPIPISGTVTSAGQYLNLSFNWNGNTRTGVAFIDRVTSRLIINTVGQESAEVGNQSFTADLVRQ